MKDTSADTSNIVPMISGFPEIKETLIELRKEKPLPKEDVYEIKEDVYNKNQGRVVSQKNFDETKKLITSFKENISKPQLHFSYEASTVLLVLIGLKKTNIQLNKLPKIDQDLVASVVTEGYDTTSFEIELDKYNDFILTFNHKLKAKTKKSFFFVNTVANPRQEDLGYGVDVPVEVDNQQIKIGNITLPKQSVDSINFGKEKKKSVVTASEFDANDLAKSLVEDERKEIRVTNKNAYEIRTDILMMALDWLKFKYDNESEKNTIKDEAVLDTAFKFYKFVENKRC
jgi:hypothetical protein